MVRSIMWVSLGVLVGLPLMFYLVLYLFQDSLIFFRTGIDRSRLEQLREEYPGGELFLTAPDGTRLHGWLIRNTAESRSPLLIYFGGNAEEVSWNLPDFTRFSGWSVLLVNYRGYGLSEGRPGESNLFSDALFLYDGFSGRADVDSGRIVAMGRSLGTGVAVYLASRRPLLGVVLISPFDSLSHLARKFYPLVPVSWLLKHPFDSVSRAAAVRVPMLAVVASDDEIIAPAHSLTLVRQWGGPSRVVVIPGADHNSIQTGPGYWESIRGFLDERLAGA